MNTQIKSQFPAFAIAVFISMLPSFVYADVTYASVPANITMTPGVSFATQIQVSSTNNSLGAFSILIEYDTNVFQLVGVSPQSGAGFSNNIFVDLASLRSGTTRVVGFQTTTKNSQPSSTVLNLTWQTVGTTIINSGITNIVETSLDSSWHPNQTWTLQTSGTLNQTSSDGSGLPDWWEKMYFGHVGVNPNADADTNGLSNLQKYLAGLNPTNASSTVLITKIEVTNSGVLIFFNTVLGRMYWVLKTPRLASGDWSAISTNFVSGTGSEQSMLDPIPPAQSSQYFYRLEVLGAVQTSGAPLLTLAYSGNQVIVSWPSSVPGWTLQTNSTLSTGTWVNYGGTIINNSVTNAPPTGSLFFRLSHP